MTTDTDFVTLKCCIVWRSSVAVRLIALETGTPAAWVPLEHIHEDDRDAAKTAPIQTRASFRLKRWKATELGFLTGHVPGAAVTDLFGDAKP